MTAVAGSGIRIMSDSLIPFQPAIEEPSNILPSLKNPSSTSRVGMVTCCSLPIVSVKRRSTNLASFSLINFRTSAGVICVLALVCYGPGRPGLLDTAANVPLACTFEIKHLRTLKAIFCIKVDQWGQICALIWCTNPLLVKHLLNYNWPRSDVG